MAKRKRPDALKIDWSRTCEKCLGELVPRRIYHDGKMIAIMQCSRCRFFNPE